MSKLSEIPNAGINTAGAYLCMQGLYLFAMGIRPHDGKIPIVRLGGHRIGRETGWQCAVREVYEETGLHLEPVLPRQTYLADWDHLDAELQEVQWENEVRQEPVPFLVIIHHREENAALSLMYLAHAEGVPVPSSEVKGLLLLNEREIHRLCQAPETLEQYLCRGGRAIMNAEFDKNLVLEPFAQHRLLSRILSIHSG